jgi:predicted Zn finger-like uncharacterized protein
MKFLCDNCKAKYQIADEKIAGRTLKMKCRKCGHDIIIHGESMAAAGSTPAPAAPEPAPPAAKKPGPPPAPPARRSTPPTPPPAAAPAPRAGALGADFRRQMSAPAPPPAQAPPPEQWHVAINDVPVGPIRRAELSRKVETGAVGPDSLVWREGFDDWRPLGEVPELADLLEPTAATPPPAISASPPPVLSARPASSADSLRAGGMVAPVGGRQGAFPSPSVAPPITRPAGLLREEPLEAPPAPVAQPAPSPPQPEPAAPTRRGPAIPVGGWIAIAGAGAFGVALAVMVAGKLLGGDAGDAVASAADAPPIDSPEAYEAPAEPDMVLEEGDMVAMDEEGGDDEASEAAQPAASASQPSRAQPATRQPTTGSTAGGKKLTAEQQRMLERFAGESGAAPGNIRGSGGSGGGGSAGGKGLDARQLTTVVSKNRPELQRCYETAVRGMGDPPTVRMDVDVTVGMSGTVTRVRARGSGVGNLKDCIERSVRRWRFPASGNETQTSFPVVFSGG